MMKLDDRKALSETQADRLAACGIYCGACDALLGKSKQLAGELHRILDGFNLVDIGPIAINVEPPRIVDFLDVLSKINQGVTCRGCGKGGGNPVCPIRTCAQDRGYLTCAECDELPCFEPAADFAPMGKETFLSLITKRYKSWNIANLERMRQVGYLQFTTEMEAKVSEGFLTSDVISPERVMTEYFRKMEDAG